MTSDERKPISSVSSLLDMAAAPKSGAAVHIKMAMGADIARMIPMMNAAFAIETFLEGSRNR